MENIMGSAPRKDANVSSSGACGAQADLHQPAAGRCVRATLIEALSRQRDTAWFPKHLEYVQQLMQPLPHDAHILAPARLESELLQLTRHQLPWHLHVDASSK